MLMGRVVGTVVSTQKDQNIVGFKLLTVQNVDMAMNLTNSYTVAVDACGAGLGDVVIVVQGGSARLTEQTKNKPVDAVVVAIVDTVEILGVRRYDKAQDSELATSSH